MSASQSTDKSAAFTGLILGAVALFVIVFAIVRMTTSHFENKPGHGAPSAAEATKTP